MSVDLGYSDCLAKGGYTSLPLAGHSIVPEELWAATSHGFAHPPDARLRCQPPCIEYV